VGPIERRKRRGHTTVESLQNSLQRGLWPQKRDQLKSGREETKVAPRKLTHEEEKDVSQGAYV